MTILNRSIINKLTSLWPHSAVYACAYLKHEGFNHSLITYYRRANWLKAVGRGAVARAGDEIDWTGGLYAIQKQLKLPIYAGAKTALELQGSGHFVPLGGGYPIYLFGAPKTKIPAWFKGYNWEVKLVYSTLNLFASKHDLGITELNRGSYAVFISSRERAILEVLYLLPAHQDFEEAKLLMEGLRTLRPKLVQSLLENCNSIKVKRLFMYLAEVCNMPWVTKINVAKIDFGKGKRVVGSGGVFNSKYNLSVPRIHESGSEQ